LEGIGRVTRRVIATIHFNTDRYGHTLRKGAFDFAEFAKLMQDFDRSRKSSVRDPAPYYYVIYSLDNPGEGTELCLFFHEVDLIARDE
jgi:hypothetical protein